jgi:hypothetical protein
MFTSPDLIRIVALCVVLAGVETLHGIARTVLLAPRVGKALAIKLSVMTGTLLAFAVCYFLVPPIGLKGFLPHLYLGGVLAAFMAAFDILIGKFVMHLKWSSIVSDFNPASGNYLSVGLFLLVLIPSLVGWLNGQ